MKISLIFILFFLSYPAWTSTCVVPEASTDFSLRLDNVITDFTIDNYDYSVNFNGGLVKIKDSTVSFIDRHWVILPAGNTVEGLSTGEAVVIINPPAASIMVDLQAGADVNARAQAFGVGGLIEEYVFANGQTLTIDLSDVNYSPEISQLKIIIDGGTAETTMSYFSVRGDISCVGGPVTVSSHLFFLLLISVIILLRMMRENIPNFGKNRRK